MRRLSASSFQSCAENRNFNIPICDIFAKNPDSGLVKAPLWWTQHLSPPPSPPGAAEAWALCDPRCPNVSWKHECQASWEQMMCSFNGSVRLLGEALASQLESAQAPEMPLPPGACSSFITRKVRGHRKCLTAENRLSFKGFPVFSTAFT